MIELVINFLKKLFGIIETETFEEEIKIFEKKEFMTEYELSFYKKIKEL